MKKLVARLLTRIEGEGDGLILGALMKSGQGELESNSVYELYKCELSGDIVLKYLGPSVVGSGLTPKERGINGSNWINGVESILDNGSVMFLTREEFESLNNN